MLHATPEPLSGVRGGGTLSFSGVNRPVVRCPPMCRLPRRLFTLGSAVSLTGCVAAAAMWARSHTAEDRFVIRSPGSPYALRSTDGSLRLGNEHLWLDWRARVIAATEQRLAIGKEWRKKWDRRLAISERWRWRTPPDRAALRAELDRLRQEIDALDDAQDVLRPAMFSSPPAVPRVAHVLPHWVPTTALAVLPTLWFLCQRRGERRQRLGLCPTCGCDLRASPERCPECGAEKRGLTF